MVCAAVAIGINLSAKAKMSPLMLANLEALTDTETDDCDSPGKVISIGPELAIICHYKNKNGGVTAGCKEKTDHTCTVQKTNLPNL